MESPTRQKWKAVGGGKMENNTLDNAEIIKERKTIRDVNNILSGSNFFGKCDIDRHTINPFVVLIGEPGKTQSIAEWMRTVWALCLHPDNDNSWAIVEGFKWFSCPDFNKLDNKNWFFGFKITRNGKEKLIVCSGADNYTDEGGRVKQIADKFMEMVWPGPISIISADNLIWALTGGLI